MRGIIISIAVDDAVANERPSQLSPILVDTKHTSKGVFNMHTIEFLLM